MLAKRASAAACMRTHACAARLFNYIFNAEGITLHDNFGPPSFRGPFEGQKQKQALTLTLYIELKAWPNKVSK